VVNEGIVKAAAFLIRVRPPVDPRVAEPLLVIIVPRPFGAGWTLAVPAKAGMSSTLATAWATNRWIASIATMLIRNFMALSRVYLCP
jgi:hypothetical protein